MILEKYQFYIKYGTLTIESVQTPKYYNFIPVLFLLLMHKTVSIAAEEWIKVFHVSCLADEVHPRLLSTICL